MNILFKNCRENWPKGICAFANVCGYCSTAIWFVVLVPQIWKNWKRRSVEGLSILWATANFTASLVNLFFAFHVSLPVYLQISAVYMPILELTILVQFWIYSKHSFDVKLAYGGGCVFIWVTIITVELAVSDSTEKVQWVAIVLWSAESFPQVGAFRGVGWGGRVVFDSWGGGSFFICRGSLLKVMEYRPLSWIGQLL